MWKIIQGLLKKLGGIFKTPEGVVGALILGLIMALGMALSSRDHWKNESKEWQTHSVNLELRLAFERSRQDTIRIPGEYHVDTLWRESVRIDFVGGKVCTTSVPCPQLSGSIAIDTTRQFGPEENPFTIRVAGNYYWPQKHAHKNWTVIDVQGWKEWPTGPTAARHVHSYAIGLATIVGAQSRLSIGLHARANRLTVFGGYEVTKRSFTGGIGCEVIRF